MNPYRPLPSENPEQSDREALGDWEEDNLDEPGEELPVAPPCRCPDGRCVC